MRIDSVHPQPQLSQPVALQPLKVCAIIVTFNPCNELRTSVEAVIDQVSHVVIVDNNSEPTSLAFLKDLEQNKVRVVRNPDNLGIATALNIGVNEAKAIGCDWVLTLDQDSVCEPGMVEKLKAVYLNDSDRSTIGVLAPVNFDRESGYVSAEFRKPGKMIIHRDHVMTSGNLVPVSLFDRVGPYDDDMFIDYVDHEFCLRAKRAGFRVLIVSKARIAHRLGHIKGHSFFGLFSFFSHNYSPIRHYYRCRNRVIVYRRHFGAWVCRDQSFAFKDLIKVLFVEQNSGAKLRAMVRGTVDGLLGRLGREDGANYLTPKAPKYFVEFREEIVPLLPARSERALDLGCGSGATSGKLRELGVFGWVCGVEGNPEVAEIAAKVIDQVLIGDIEKMSYPFPPAHFDTVMTLDILEHLVDPWRVLDQLKGLIKPGGRLVISIPNIRHYSVLIPLLVLGDFRYQQEGILDSTHVRFFTRRTTIKMLEAAGFVIEKLDHTGGKRGLGAAVNRFTFGIFEEFFIFQNLIACRKPIESSGLKGAELTQSGS